jgi:hypothetical protein
MCLIGALSSKRRPREKTQRRDLEGRIRRGPGREESRERRIPGEKNPGREESRKRRTTERRTQRGETQRPERTR